MPNVTFTPLARNRYRVNAGGHKSRIIKGAQLDRTRRMIENGGRKPLPALKPVVRPGFQVQKAYYPMDVRCPSCKEYYVHMEFGTRPCRMCGAVFTSERRRMFT